MVIGNSLNLTIRPFNKLTKKEVEKMKVKDVMMVKFPHVRKGMTLKEVSTLLSTRRMAGLPVVDEKGKVVGVVMREDLLHLFVPEEVAFLKGMPPDKREPQSLFEVEGDFLHVEDIMRKARKTISPNAEIVKAAVEMQKEGVEVLPVVQQKKLKGILTSNQLYKAFFEK
jgi:predicted transcriptional regulator